MKIAVIYYSYEGNTALVAENIREASGADIFEIETADNKKRTGLAKYAWGGVQVIMHKKPALLPLSVNLQDYDLVIFGTPVWAASPAPVLVSFLDGKKITGKKIALFCCHKGGMGKTLDKLKTLLPGNTIAGEIDFTEPSREDTAALKQKINGWLKSFGA